MSPKTSPPPPFPKANASSASNHASEATTASNEVIQERNSEATTVGAVSVEPEDCPCQTIDGVDDEYDEYDEDDDSIWQIPLHQLDFQACVGEGTTATVWLARYDGREVAVKNIRNTNAGLVNRETLKAVQRELQTLSSVTHPSILEFVGIVMDADYMAIVLEYCAGGSLFDLMHNRWDVKVCWEQKFKILTDTSSALAYLHGFDPPILHRDLKSLNLMLKQEICSEFDNPFIKLADFGYARVQERAMTQAVGTKHWMAPEVLKGTKYSEKADVFSFGMVAYEVCCRRVPFERLDPTAAARQISRGARPDLSDTAVVPQEAAPELLDLIARCWAQQPEVRPSFQSVHREALALYRVEREQRLARPSCPA